LRQDGQPAERIGILGGTFDPPHVGHLVLAEQCRQALGLDRVLVLPAGQPPHKRPEQVHPFALRLEMARRAFPAPEFQVDPMEGERAGPSYTVDSLRALRARWGPGPRFWLLMGSDSLEEMETWRNPEEIVRLCRLGVYGRPGYETGPRSRRWMPHVDRVEGPLLDISSSHLREMVARGRSIRFLVPDPVWEFIRERGLYAGDGGGEGAAGRG
jgi:nicotinate-nucleotide adenylyltransferase